MSKPVIGWLNSELDALSLLKFTSKKGAYEPVIAEQASVVETINIANNFTKGVEVTTATDDAVNCYLKITDRSGTTNSFVVSETWTRVKCIGDAGQTEYTEIGVKEGNEVTVAITAGDTLRPNTISGAANDGTIEGTGNYNVAKVEMFVQPPLATAAQGGVQQFRYVLVYSYGATA